MYEVILTTVIIASILLVIANKWLLAKGILKPVYWLGIAIAITLSTKNTMLFIHDMTQWSVMLLNVMNVYGIIMSVVGLRRLKREELIRSLKFKEPN